MISPLLTAAFFAVATYAAPSPAAQYGNSLFQGSSVCKTSYAPGTSTSGPIPVIQSTSVVSVSTTVTETVSASEETLYITPDAVTETACVDATTVASASVGTRALVTGAANATRSTVTVTSWLNSTRTFITDYTATTKVCTRTTTIAGDGVTTIYTGTYNGTVAKRTASPMDARKANLQKRDGPPQDVFTHHRGDESWRDSYVPAEVICVALVTQSAITTELVTDAPHTATLTAATPTVTVTSTDYDTITPAALVASSGVRAARTVTITRTTTVQIRTGGVYTSSVLCTSTKSGTPSSTTTQALKCAPTNMISSVNGYSIEAVRAGTNSSIHLTGAKDPSACCQRCVDEADCAGAEMDPDAGNCFLYTSASCGLAFTYSDDGKDGAAGSGLQVQAGCGSIQAQADVASNIMKIFQS